MADIVSVCVIVVSHMYTVLPTVGLCVCVCVHMYRVCVCVLVVGLIELGYI